MREVQVRQAPDAEGFDAACGFLHVDRDGRDSPVYDLMACARGAVDGLVLDLLARTVLHTGDFVRTREGAAGCTPSWRGRRWRRVAWGRGK